MGILKIIDIILIVILLFIGIETIIKIKSSSGKEIEEVRKPLLLRIDIIMILTILIAIITIINVVIK